jgi:SpoU rRNA methylase family enzyme
LEGFIGLVKAVSPLIPVVHNVSSVQRLVDVARLVYGFDIGLLVASKVYGAAAQSGIPEVMRLAFKSNKSFLVLPDIGDVLELLKPDVTLIVTFDYAGELIDPFNPPVYNGRVLVVFNGGEPDFSAGEVRFGKPIYIKGVPRRIGVVAEASIILYSLLSRIR